MVELAATMIVGAFLGYGVWLVFVLIEAVSYARDMASLERERRDAERKYRPGGREYQREYDRAMRIARGERP